MRLSLVLMVVLALVGCGKSEKSASEVAAEKQLAKRAALIEKCQYCLEQKDFRYMKEVLNDPVCQNDPEFSRFQTAVIVNGVEEQKAKWAKEEAEFEAIVKQSQGK
jgi:hypothetical protein